MPPRNLVLNGQKPSAACCIAFPLSVLSAPLDSEHCDTNYTRTQIYCTIGRETKEQTWSAHHAHSGRQ
jgi:hypothetical protein